MKVMELRALLAGMPGEMNVYLVNGHGVAEAKHIFEANLVGVEQFCELRTYFEDHTPQFLDMKIERRTGFANRDERSEEHTSELQSLMRISYAVFCLKKTNK